MNFMASLFFGAGVAAWLYSQLARRTGNANPKSNMLTAGITGFIAAIVFFTFLKFVLNIE